jgi:RNA-directed DNA polymerase
MYQLDVRWNAKATRLRAVYSRYADDIFVGASEAKALDEFLESLKADLQNCQSPKLSINKKKTWTMNRSKKVLVTGIVLSSEGKISVGRPKKRHIKSLVHRFLKRTASQDDLNYLRGYLAFVNSVEPEFLGRLKRKFGKRNVERLLGNAPQP